jgi:hypothetical protein
MIIVLNLVDANSKKIFLCQRRRCHMISSTTAIMSRNQEMESKLRQALAKFDGNDVFHSLIPSFPISSDTQPINFTLPPGLLTSNRNQSKRKRNEIKTERLVPSKSRQEHQQVLNDQPHVNDYITLKRAKEILVESEISGRTTHINRCSTSPSSLSSSQNATMVTKPKSVKTCIAQRYSCTRFTSYDPTRRKSIQKGQWMNSDTVGTTTSRFRRQTKIEIPCEMVVDEVKILGNSSNTRATRANQRCIKKSVAALGATNLGIDILASRAPHLRFDRSSIHSWGVFADEDIAADVMIIEYRGEILSNAMAEKREKEYEVAKIGSDYMFRIDGVSVCDATRQGTQWKGKQSTA